MSNENANEHHLFRNAILIAGAAVGGGFAAYKFIPKMFEKEEVKVAKNVAENTVNKTQHAVEQAVKTENINTAHEAILNNNLELDNDYQKHVYNLLDAPENPTIKHMKEQGLDPNAKYVAGADGKPSARILTDEEIRKMNLENYNNRQDIRSPHTRKVAAGSDTDAGDFTFGISDDGILTGSNNSNKTYVSPHSNSRYRQWLKNNPEKAQSTVAKLEGRNKEDGLNTLINRSNGQLYSNGSDVYSSDPGYNYKSTAHTVLFNREYYGD